jgi:hypothetical protein
MVDGLMSLYKQTNQMLNRSRNVKNKIKLRVIFVSSPTRGSLSSELSRTILTKGEASDE